MSDTPENAEARTEAPTARRRQRAREAGQLAVSRELTMLASLGGATLGLVWLAPVSGRAILGLFRSLLEHGAADNVAPGAAVYLAMLTALWAAGPVLLLMLLAAAAAVLGQTGFAISAEPLRPQLSRISPVAGLHRLLGPDNLVEAARSVAKLLIIGVVVWRGLAADLPRLLVMPFQAFGDVPGVLGAMVLRLLVAVLAVQAAIAVFDLLWVRLRLTQRLRMSRQDIREETKETEGDPRTKMRLRRLRLARARRRMLAAVPKATVVVTNPTHYAIALSYDRARGGAPRVVAKGVDSLAERIRAVAREHNVPLVSNPPLARALHRLELEAEIPAEHYKAVAEIISFVWRLRERVA